MKIISLLPLVNEKTYDLSKSKNVYVFKVDKDINKLSVASAVKSQFEVDVVSVNTVNMPGKAKRTISLSGKRTVNSTGNRPDFKKAYVTIKEGQSLPFFETIDEAEEKRESSQEKFDKAIKKQAAKESKATGTDSSSKRRFLRTKTPEGK